MPLICFTVLNASSKCFSKGGWQCRPGLGEPVELHLGLGHGGLVGDLACVLEDIPLGMRRKSSSLAIVDVSSLPFPFPTQRLEPQDLCTKLGTSVSDGHPLARPTKPHLPLIPIPLHVITIFDPGLWFFLSCRFFTHSPKGSIPRCISCVYSQNSMNVLNP